MIEIINLSKRYKKSKVKALDNVSLTIQNGIFGLLGSNGAGKTTLMNILCTITDFTEGKVNINGIKLKSKNYIQLRKVIGYVPQESGGYPDLTVKDSIDYFCILNGLGSEHRKNRVSEIIEYINLEKHENKKHKNLSGGMKRRLSLGIALINDPEILIVDEPTTGIDPNERIRMRNLLLTLGKEKTIILSTHIIEDIAHTSQELAILSEGKIKYSGSVKELLAKTTKKVWEIEADNEESIKEIASKNIVASIIKHESISKIKIISNSKPFEKAIPISPTLEDAFIATERLC